MNLYPDPLKGSVDIERVFAIESTRALLSKLSLEQNAKLVLTFSTWRLKYVAGDHIIELCRLYPVDYNDNNFVCWIVRFLKDPEPEVRLFIRFNKIIPRISLSEFIKQIIPYFNETLAKDSNHHMLELSSLK